MFLRAYRHDDKRLLQQLFYDTVHTVNARDYIPEQLDIWAPVEPDREAWARLDGQACFVVEFRKKPVGFASLDDSGEIDFLFVHKDFQGKGIATALVKQLERLARKRGMLLLHTRSSITARTFFEKYGFILTAEKRKILRGMEFVQYSMEKRLAPP